MNVRMLLKGEYIKASRSFATRAVLLLIVAVALLVNASNWYEERHYPTQTDFVFPAAWAEILGQPAQMSMFFCVVLIILLMASEFTWRTARQNVIDGLSKDEWFASKVLLTLAILLFTLITNIIIGVAFAITNSFDTLVRFSDVKILLGSMLGMIGFASLAFLLAIVIRSAGSALGVFLLLISMVESVITMLVLKLHKESLPKTVYLPFHLFGEMMDPRSWDPALMQRAIDVAKRTGRDLPTHQNMTFLTAVAVAYIILFFGIAYLNYSKRDL